MECPRCDGMGKYINIFGDVIRCDFCYGTGEIKRNDDGSISPIGKQKPQTNEEWFCGLSTEEKAEFIATQCFWAYSAGFRRNLETKYACGEYWDKWLRENYNENNIAQ